VGVDIDAQDKLGQISAEKSNDNLNVAACGTSLSRNFTKHRTPSLDGSTGPSKHHKKVIRMINGEQIIPLPPFRARHGSYPMNGPKIIVDRL
jgi:hypothetical protein